MGYYQTFLEKQKRLEEEKNRTELEEKKLKHKKIYEKNKEYLKKNAREYYWKNREYILERQKTRKYNTSDYYKKWYQENKEELNKKRYGMDNKLSTDNKKNKSSSFGNRGKQYIRLTQKIQIPTKKVLTEKSFVLFG
jgi:hypothetical protein